MSAAGAAAFTDQLLESLVASQDGPVTLHVHAPSSSPRSILAASEGDRITVVQPDGEQETYRVASAAPTEFGVSFQVERAEP